MTRDRGQHDTQMMDGMGGNGCIQVGIYYTIELPVVGT